MAGKIRAMFETQERLRAWYDNYMAILCSVEGAVVRLSDQQPTPVREQLYAIREALSPSSKSRLIKEQGAVAKQTLDGFTQALLEGRSLREKEFKRVIRVTAEAGAAMIRSGNTHAEEITQFAARVEQTSCLESVVEIRCQMASRVAELNAVARRIQDESQQHAEALTRKMQKIEERLKAAEALTETDPLTGLGNRRLLVRIIDEAIERKIPFCLVLLDLNSFKAVNDRFGHAEGDRLLKAVASGLAGAVRGGDAIGRWGGDEFVILLKDVDLAGAQARSEQIQTKVFGEFMLQRYGKVSRFAVSASIGTAEYRAGESSDELFERADQLLYAVKRQRHETVLSVTSPRQASKLVRIA
ncbi:MAG: GGDEF domain-containing protein [Acidobacteriota bacterium]